jgi:hypothetical protein
MNGSYEQEELHSGAAHETMWSWFWPLMALRDVELHCLHLRLTP